MKVERNFSSTAKETALINFLISASSGATTFHFIKGVLKNTAKKGGIFVKTGSFVISAVASLEMTSYIYKKLKEVILWQQILMCLA